MSIIDLIRAEIERSKKYYLDRQEYDFGWNNALEEILSFLDTLEEPSLPSDLDEAAEKYSRNISCYYYAGDQFAVAFKAGAKWDAQQGYLTERVLQGRNAIETLDMDALMEKGITWGDKVIVQIRKK